MKKKLLFLWLMLLMMGISGFAQNLSDYVMTTGTDETRWIPLTTTTNLISGTGDSKASAVTDIGFTFNFAGTDYTQFSVNSDGNLRLGGTVTGTSYYTTPFSSTNANNNNPKINMMGCDGYITDSGYVYKEVIGTAPDRVCVIEFATSTYATASRNSLLRWQVQLYETSNEIQIAFPSTLPPILPAVARQPGMCVNNTNIILIDAYHESAFYNAGQSTAHIPSGTWPDVDRYYHFTISSCQTPPAIIVSNITTISADVTWNAPADATDFVFEYKPVSGSWEEDATTLYVSDTTYTLNGLDPNTYYDVRVANNCSAEQSNYISTTFHTECTAISVASEPYFEGFEGYVTNSFPDCWTRITGYTSGTSIYPYITNSTTAHSGGGYLLATTNSSNPVNIALPEFTESVNTLRLSFWMKPVGTTSYYGRVDVGVMTDLADTSSFTLVKSWTALNIGSTTWTKYEVDFDSVTPTGTDYIVIRRVVTEGTTAYGWYFDDVKVTLIPTCNAPTELDLVDATPYSVDLTWNPGEESTFSVYYKEVSETEYSFVPNVYLDGDNIYTLSNLIPGTSYVWYVSAVCSDGSETPSDPSTFTTTMIPVNLPYSTDFSAESDQEWLLNNGTCLNYWTMGSIGDTLSALYITNNGTTPGYNIGSYSVVSASKLFTVGEDEQFQISFDVNVGGESSIDYIKLFFAPPTLTYPTANSSANVPAYASNSYSQYAFDFSNYMSASTSTSTIAYKFNLTANNTIHIDALMPNPNTDPDASSTAQVVFIWKNDGSVGTQPGAIISNFSVAPVECPQPENVTVTNITSSTADVTWDLGDASSYIVEYGPHGFTLGEGEIITVTDNQATLTELTPSSLYDVYVKSLCGGGTESVNMFVMFQTACVGITTLPQFWNFDDNLTAGTTTYPLPTCWDRIVTSTSTVQYPYAYNSTTYAHSGTRSLYFTNSYSNSLAILPNIDREVLDLQDLQLSFYARCSTVSSYVRLDVGVMTDPTDDSTFTLIQTIPVTTSYTSDPYVVSFTNYSGTGAYIAFRNTSISTSSASNSYYIDDVTLEEVPACSKALYLTASPGSYSADLTWMATGEDFDVYYKADSDTEYTAVTDVILNEGVFTLTDLAASTTYTWYVVTNCDDTVYTSATATFTTLCAPYEAPFMEDFNAGVIPACWERLTGLVSAAFAGTAPTAATSGWIFTNTNVFGNTHPKLNIYGTASKYWLVSPVIDLSELTDPALTFNLALTKYNTALPIVDTNAQLDDKFMVIITTDNGATWSADNATIWSNDSTGDFVYNQISYLGEEVNISLANYVGQSIRVAFYGESTATGGDNDLHIDNVYVGEAPSCAAPSQLVISQITQTSAELSWTENGDATSWVVEYDTAGFVLGTGTTMTVYGTPNVTLTDLLDAYTYDVYVSAVCGTGGNSNPAFGSFRTACLALDEIPQTWNFDGIGSGSSVHPDCWICTNTYSTSTQYPYVYGTNAYSGNANLYFYSSSTTYSLAVLPMVDINLYPMNTLQVSFMMRSYTPGSVRMVVGVMTDPADITTFEPIDTVYNNVGGTYEFREVLFSDYVGSAPYVALKMINLSSTTYAYVDDVTLDFIPSCPRPTHLSVVNSSLNSVTLSWDENDATSWEVAYGPMGFDPDSDTAMVVSASSTPFEVQNLDEATTYQFYVRAICTGNETSPWSIPTVGSTDCDLVSLPYFEDFDSYTTSSTYSDAEGIAPDCWTTWSNNATYGAPHITSTGSYHYVHSGSNCMVFTCSSAGNDAYAALPTFTNALNTLHLNFWRQMESTTSGTLTVGYVTNLNDMHNSFVVVAVIPSVNTTSTADTISVDFTGADIPANGNICFHWNHNSTFYSCCIDDITVTSNGSGPVITDPTVATNAATAVGQTAATLNATITNPDNVTISAKGFEWKTTAGGTYTQITGTGTGTTFTADLSNLTANTSYTFKAFITFNGTTVYGDELTFTTLAQSQPTDPTVATVAASAITQTSATLNASITNPDNVTITAKGFEWKTTAGGTYTQIAGTGTGNTFTANLSGLTANTGYTYKAFITFNGTTVYGSEMTFTTLPEDVQPCNVPTNLHTTAVENEAISIAWDADANVTSWNIQYRPVGGTLSTATTNTNSYTITGLTGLTTYEIQVQANCGNGNLSDWTAAITAQTTNVGIDNYLLNSIKLYPNPANDVVNVQCTMYNVQSVEVIDVYGKVIKTMSVTENPTRINVSGLANGMYFVRVTTEQGVVTKQFVKR